MEEEIKKKRIREKLRRKKKKKEWESKEGENKRMMYQDSKFSHFNQLFFFFLFG